MKWILLTLASGALGGAIFLRVSPQKADASQRMVPWMQRLDKDANGSISRAEYVQISDGLISFDLVDLSRDGVIDNRELETFLRTVDPMWTFAEPD